MIFVQKRILYRIILQVLLMTLIISLLFYWSTKSSCQTNEKEKKIFSKYYSDCEVWNPSINPLNLFEMFFKVLNDSTWTLKSEEYSPSFEQIHQILFGPNATNIYLNWENVYGMKMNLSYPFTSITQFFFKQILRQIKIPIRFIVEVGSFQGKSTINMVSTLMKRQSNESFVMLCIDTWIGSLEHWTKHEQRRLMPIKHGRPIIYEQFFANIIFNNLTKYVIPFSTTSLIGGTFLLQNKLFPQMIFLDSSHLQGETFLELQLFWLILQKGGLIFGDDWSWKSIRCDVTRFVQYTQAKLRVFSNLWIIQKT